MAQIAARLLRNLGFLFKACGEPLEAVGERQQLLAAARLEPHFLGDAPEPHGDLAEMCHPILRKVLGHRHHLPPSAYAINSSEMPPSARATETCAGFMPALQF